MDLNNMLIRGVCFFKILCSISLLFVLISCSTVKRSEINPNTEQEQQIVQRVAELERKNQALKEQIKAIESSESSSIVGVSSKDLFEASKEIDVLQARVEQLQENLNKRPKRKFVGGTSKDARIALYLAPLFERLEKVGNENYPEKARADKIYGKVQLTTYIKSDGTLEKVELNKSSGSSLLDEHAINAVKKAAPFASFEESLRKDVDVLGITRTFSYTVE